jgi:hypothetical protein
MNDIQRQMWEDSKKGNRAAIAEPPKPPELISKGRHWVVDVKGPEGKKFHLKIFESVYELTVKSTTNKIDYYYDITGKVLTENGAPGTNLIRDHFVAALEFVQKEVRSNRAVMREFAA